MVQATYLLSYMITYHLNFINIDAACLWLEHLCLHHFSLPVEMLLEPGWLETCCWGREFWEMFKSLSGWQMWPYSKNTYINMRFQNETYIKNVLHIQRNTCKVTINESISDTHISVLDFFPVSLLVLNWFWNRIIDVIIKPHTRCIWSWLQSTLQENCEFAAIEWLCHLRDLHLF